MSFELVSVRKGKDIILFNDYKYREGYSLKCGDVVWRCLGKVCKATVKTNKEKTVIHFSSDAHTGAHPVTLRALTPTPTRRNGPTSISTPSMTVIPTAEATPVVAATPETMVTPVPPEDISLTSSFENMLRENSALREEVEKLRSEKLVVLNHSIESDQRLLEFTDKIFLPSQSLTPDQQSTAKELERALAKIQKLEEEVKELNQPCERCVIYKEESANMINSLRCLEEENKALKASISDDPSHSMLNRPSLPLPLKLRNSYDVLREVNIGEAEGDNFVTVTRKRNDNRQGRPHNNSSRRKHQIKEELKKKSVMEKPEVIQFKSVSVVGDSHVRGLSALMKKTRLGRGVDITGVCKPGARLLNIEPTSSPPIDHCYVVMAGTNDVNTASEGAILANLRRVLQTFKKSSRVLLVPIPTRYDLCRSSQIHMTVNVVNGYMAELCSRHREVELLDTSSIRRHHHTFHGLHLNGSGKRHLSRLVAEKLAHMSPPARRTNPVVRRAGILAADTTSPAPPRILPYDSYAEAVTQSAQPTVRPKDNLLLYNNVFLGNSLQVG